MTGYGIDDWLESRYEDVHREIADDNERDCDDYCDDDGFGDCDICGEPIDYCLGHGTIG